MNALDHYRKGEELLAAAEKKDPGRIEPEDVPSYALLVDQARAHFEAARTLMAALNTFDMPTHDYDAWEEHALASKAPVVPDVREFELDACDECEGKGRNCAAHGGRTGIPYRIRATTQEGSR